MYMYIYIYTHMYVCVCVCKHICVCICDMTHSYVGLELFTFVWNNGFHDDFVVLQVTRMHVLTHSHVTYSYVPHDVFMCDTTHPHVTLLYHTCDMTHTYVPHDSFICAVWLIHMCNLTYPYVTWLIHTWDLNCAHLYRIMALMMILSCFMSRVCK